MFARDLSLVTFIAVFLSLVLVCASATPPLLPVLSCRFQVHTSQCHLQTVFINVFKSNYKNTLPLVLQNLVCTPLHNCIGVTAVFGEALNYASRCTCTVCVASVRTPEPTTSARRFLLFVFRCHRSRVGTSRLVAAFVSRSRRVRAWESCDERC